MVVAMNNVPVCCGCSVRLKGGLPLPACCNGHVVCYACFNIKGPFCPYPLCSEKIKTSSGSTGSTLDQPSTAPSTKQMPALSGSSVSYENAATISPPPRSPEQGGNLQMILAAQRSQQQALQSAEVYRVVQSYAEALSETLQKIKEAGQTVGRQSKSTESLLENVQKLATYFDNVSRQGGVDERLWQRELERAFECDGKLADVQRGLSMLNLESGSLRVDLRAARVNGGPESSFTTSLDLAAEASRRPDVLAATKYLLFLLNKEDEPEIQNPHQRGDVGRNESVWNAKRSGGGALDLQASGVGSAEPGRMEAEKTALLTSTKAVWSLIGLDCSKDPKFCTSMIEKHAGSLKTLALYCVQQEQFSLLGRLPRLENLKIIKWRNNLSSDMLRESTPADRVLRSIHVYLPHTIQIELWEAFSPSLVDVSLNLEVRSSATVHRDIGPLAARTPNLRKILLLRQKKEQHTEDGCVRQRRAIQTAVSPGGIRVLCNLCTADPMDG